MNTNRYLSTTAIATILVLGSSGLVAAQGQPQGGGQAQQGGQGQAQPTQPLRSAEQALRQAQQQVTGGGQQGLQAARQAVSQAQEALGKLPSSTQGQDSFKQARQQLTEAQDAVKAQQPDRQQASAQMREAADAVAELHRGMGSDRADAASGASGAQVAVQQRAPQIEVQQQAPRVTVQQPQPQVTIQQPPPQVTVQQAQPQVTVQQQGQPQVNVERSGEPQVRVQQQAANERSTGASTAPAPAQSSGNAQRTAATPTADGMPLARTESLVGRNVVGADGKDAGEIQNLLIDGKGQVRAAVVEWGGFIGIGERTAAVPIDRIKLGTATGNDRAQLDMTKAELEKLPRYDAGEASNYGRSQGWGNDIRLFR